MASGQWIAIRETLFLTTFGAALGNRIGWHARWARATEDCFKMTDRRRLIHDRL
ncbi:hypothetical protein SBDP1_1040033 [Syntrophobacter sp. SbD1]|nr:hypothetical protein SBDP1_1040033 [Syntrophobacter sp. SbD1]